MVCRENKARSALMGLEKHLMRQAGYVRYHDHEVQSALHHTGHLYNEATNPSLEEQVALVKGLRQQIIHDDSISENEKYRESRKQPGLVTRLDQELARLETGVDEYGNPLRPEQRNLGKHYATIKRLGPILQRTMESKASFIELYARGTGNTFEDAEKRYDQLVTRRMEERENTRVDLKDGWRERLQVAGLTTYQQADLGSSNEAREALRIMESERINHLMSQPRRPAMDPSTKVEFLHPDDPKAQLRCRHCGQFGHDGDSDSCPNHSLVDAATKASDHRDQTFNRYDEARSARQAQLMLEKGPTSVDPNGMVSYRMPGDSDVTGSMVFPDEESARDFFEPIAQSEPPLSMTDVLSETDPERQESKRLAYDAQFALQTMQINPDTGGAFVRGRKGIMMFPNQEQAEEHLRVGAEGAPSEEEFKDLRRQMTAADSDAVAADAALKAAAAVSPQTSGFVQAVNYDPDSGLLEVTTHPYVRKRSGEQMPAKTYRYRMSKAEYEQLLASPSVGTAINQTAFARGPAGWPYKWENDADAAAAAIKVRCPTCQQFAAPNSSHRCPVRGPWGQAEEANYRERLRQQREKEKLEHLPARVAPTTRRRDVHTQSQAQLVGGGTMRFPERNSMIATRDQGSVALGGFQGQYLDAHVTGKVYTWNEPGSGDPLVTASGVRCSKCGSPPCPHTAKVLDTMTTQYRATRVSNVSPGSRAFLRDRGTAQDAPTAPVERLPIEEIRKIRGSREQYAMRQEQTRRVPFTTTPIDAQSGRPVGRSLREWTGPEGVKVDLTSDAGTTDAVTSALHSNGFPWAEVVSTPDGGMLVRSSRPLRNGKMPFGQRKRLGEALGLSAVSEDGVYIPGDSGWRYEMLDRAHGREPRVFGSRVAAGDDLRRVRVLPEATTA